MTTSLQQGLDYCTPHPPRYPAPRQSAMSDTGADTGADAGADAGTDKGLSRASCRGLILSSFEYRDVRWVGG